MKYSNAWPCSRLLRSRRFFQRVLRTFCALGVFSISGALSILVLPAFARAEEAQVPAEKPLTLELLMESMATTRGVKAEFREEKHLALLVEPLTTEGELYFVPPRRLARRTTRPGRTVFVIDGDRFHFRDETGDESFNLSQNPIAREFVENFIVLFNGDLAELKRRYEVSFRVGAEQWELSLRPRQAPLSDLVESITMRGDGRQLGEMEMQEKDGDRTVTRFSSVEVDRVFSEDEQRSLFAIPDTAPAP